MTLNLGKPNVLPKLYSRAPPLTESIYNLIPREEVPPVKPQRYKSIYTNSVKSFYQSQKSPHKTMGYYKPPLPSPKKFLKKHTRELLLQGDQKKSQACVPSEKQDEDKRHLKRPPVPKHDERPPMPHGSPSKNFIKENIRNVSRAVPKKPEPKWVDSQKGNSILLEFSGLVPKFCTKKEYGVTPKYLVMRQQDMDYSRKKYEEFVREQLEKEAPKRISDDERNKLIANLKKNWEEATHDFICLPMTIETISMKRRKECIEERLKALERDINLLQKHKDIYVLE